MSIEHFCVRWGGVTVSKKSNIMKSNRSKPLSKQPCTAPAETHLAPRTSQSNPFVVVQQAHEDVVARGAALAHNPLAEPATMMA